MNIKKNYYSSSIMDLVQQLRLSPVEINYIDRKNHFVAVVVVIRENGTMSINVTIQLVEPPQCAMVVTFVNNMDSRIALRFSVYRILARLEHEFRAFRPSQTIRVYDDQSDIVEIHSADLDNNLTFIDDRVLINNIDYKVSELILEIALDEERYD
jgi:hypothetical protein